MDLKKVLLLVFLAVSVFLVYGGLFVFEGTDKEEVSLVIEPGEGVLEIARSLEEAGVVRNRYVFLLFSLIKGQMFNLQAGSYLFPVERSLGKVVDIVARGETVFVKVTVPECSTVEETAEIMGRSLGRKVSLSEKKEGRLFPDTYHLDPDVSDEEIERVMVENFEERFPAETGERSEDEVLVMASILESELREEEDMRMVADLLWRRLEAGMALQVDASPYTYERRGLPPAPLCSPGLRGIEAALDPEPNGYWYYLNTPEGETLFSESFKEHSKKKHDNL